LYNYNNQLSSFIYVNSKTNKEIEYKCSLFDKDLIRFNQHARRRKLKTANFKLQISYHTKYICVHMQSI